MDNREYKPRPKLMKNASYSPEVADQPVPDGEFFARDIGDRRRSRSDIYEDSGGQDVIRFAVFTLAVHLLSPILYLALFEQYVGDDIVWHPRHVIVYTASASATIVCPILLTGLMSYARWRSPRFRTEGIFEVWVVDMIYTLVIFAFMLTPAVY